jgi:hypothetical protein
VAIRDAITELIYDKGIRVNRRDAVIRIAKLTGLAVLEHREGRF